MAVETAADRALFVSADEFGVVARYFQAGCTEAAVTGIFDNAHLMAEAGEAGVSGTAPVFHCTADEIGDLPMGEALQGDRLIIGGQEYSVNDIQPDGTGMVSLILERR